MTSISGQLSSGIIASEHGQLSWDRLWTEENVTKELPSKLRQVDLEWLRVTALV